MNLGNGYGTGICALLILLSLLGRTICARVLDTVIFGVLLDLCELSLAARDFSDVFFGLLLSLVEILEHIVQRMVLQEPAISAEWPPLREFQFRNSGHLKVFEQRSVAHRSHFGIG